jgi:hypothetical protein
MSISIAATELAVVVLIIQMLRAFQSLQLQQSLLQLLRFFIKPAVCTHGFSRLKKNKNNTANNAIVKLMRMFVAVVSCIDNIDVCRCIRMQQ